MIPFFSVVIPLYNKEKFIDATLKTVLDQSFSDFEIIIINDGSTDNSLNIVEQIKDKRIRLYSNENIGLPSTRNYGIHKAKSDFMAFLDADDLWREDYLETIHKLILTYKDFSAFATGYKTLTPKSTADLSVTKFSLNHIKHICNYLDMLNSNISPSSLVVNKKVFKEIGYFDESVNYGEDEDFYIRLLKKYDFVIYESPKIYYRILFENQMTSPNANFKKVIPDFNKYLNNENCEDLKPYLDFIHFKLVVLFKMEKNNKLVTLYKEKIDPANLSNIQSIKYHLPIPIFYLLKKIYLKTF
ncbi:glycosyltransferase family 2 protein [Algibacter sp. L1A34]|uniref:glycosyltransferase family 2 protein n=1 Tax=Algibacter sp. L1A34 TaxID=2686365 RepID=UPI00131B9D79|nr:glycosyltransferase family A protein [Algibacter sp. L1A34]